MKLKELRDQLNNLAEEDLQQEAKLFFYPAEEYGEGSLTLEECFEEDGSKTYDFYYDETITKGRASR